MNFTRILRSTSIICFRRKLFTTDLENIRCSQSAFGSCSGSVALYRGGQLVTAGQSAPSPDGWWNLAFTAAGSDLRLTVNGLTVLAALDVSPLPPGTITLLSSDGLLVEWLSVMDTSLVASADVVVPLSVPAESQPSVLPPEIAFMTASPMPPQMQAGMSAQIAVNGIPPGEPGGPNCSWVYLYAANAAELITAYGQSGACAVIWLTGVDYLFDTNAPYGTYDLFRLNGQNIWIIRDEALGPAALRVGPNVTVFPRLFYVDTNSQLTLINVNVDNFGVAGTARGGAIYNDNIVRLYRTTFTNNRAADGGAVGSLGILKIWNSTFANNRSLYGGAVSNVKYNLFPSQVGIMTASCVTFQGNSAEYGGAVVASGGATTTITNSNFISNSNPDGASRAYYSGPTNPTADLTNNWWNSPNGPDVGGQTVSGPANTAGFLSALVNIDACPRPAELVIPMVSSLATVNVAFDPARFDAQLGTIRAQLDGLSGQLSGDNVAPFRADMLDACDQIPDSGKQRGFCKIHASMLLILRLKQSETGSSNFDHAFLLQHLVVGEYGSDIRRFGNHTYSSSSPVRQWVWPDEAIARQLYMACGINGCQGDELYEFLEYFQNPRNGSFFTDYDKLARIKDNAISLSYYANLFNALVTSVEAILSPPPDSPPWVNGVIPNTQPYGYGTDIKVESGSLSQRITCNGEGFAYIVYEHPDGRVNIFFGTTINTANDESCNAVFRP